MNRKFLAFFVLMGLCLLMAQQFSGPQVVRAAGEDYFVSPTGTDANSCAQPNPCDPLTALTAAAVGDVIYFAHGTYYTTPITVTKGVTLLGGWDGVGTGGVVVNPVLYKTIIEGDEVRRLMIIDETTGDPVVISGFTFQNGDPLFLSPRVGGGIYLKDGLVTIENNHFSDNYGGDYGGAIYVGSKFNVHIRKNSFLNNTAQYSGGAIFVNFSDRDNAALTIEENSFTGSNADNGSDIGVSSSYVVFTKNLVKDTLGNSSISVSVSPNAPIMEISNNFFIRASGNPLDFSGDNTLPHQVLNNTIVGAGTAVISYSGTSVNIVNNIITHSSIAAIQTSGGTLTGSNNLFYMNFSNPNPLTDPIYADPLYVNPAADNYHIQRGSPAIDAGVTVALIDDFDGDSRPQGDYYDIGADEFIAGTFIYIPILKR